MEFFVLLCVFYVGAMLLYYLLSGRMKKAANPTGDRLWSIGAVGLVVIWMILFYINETKAEHPLNGDELIRRYFPFPLWIALMAGGTIFLLWLLGRKPGTFGKAGSGIRKAVRVVVSLLFTAGVSVQFYAPNIFQDIQGGTYHSHAYTNSIIHACWLIPYSEDLECLYEIGRASGRERV